MRCNTRHHVSNAVFLLCTAPDGSVVAPDGSVVAPDGSVVVPDGSVDAPGGSIDGALRHNVKVSVKR